MIGFGTIVNVIGIILGGLCGMLIGRLFREQWRDTLCKCCGVTTMFLGIGGAMEKMMTGTSAAATVTLSFQGSMFLVICVALGGLIGEILNIEDHFERFGEWLKQKSGNEKDRDFVEAFVTASFTVCIGAMAIIGSIQDGIQGNYAILATKAVLDFVIVLVMTCSLGKGCIFSAIPVAILQGSVTAAARLLMPVMTDAALSNLSMVGSVLIFCVGVNLVFGKTIRVANLLPAVVLAVIGTYLPV